MVPRLELSSRQSGFLIVTYWMLIVKLTNACFLLMLFRLEREHQDVERLRNLTEDQWRMEVKSNPKQITNKADKGKYRFLQKYYHRGAFFLVSV